MINGYYLTKGNKGYFHRTNAQRKTAAVVNAFIETLGARRGLCPEWIERCKADEETRRRISRDMDAATLEQRTTPAGTAFYIIRGKYFSECMPAEDFDNDIVVF